MKYIHDKASEHGGGSFRKVNPSKEGRV